MVALPDQCALTVAQKFMVHFVVTFGCPLEVHTDQGKDFDNNLFENLCEILKIAKTRTTPYHPSSNGQVERYNTMVLQMIRCYIDNNKTWDIDLPLLAMALYSTIHRQTGYTPNRLMLGKSFNQYISNGESPWWLTLSGAMRLVRRSCRSTLKSSSSRSSKPARGTTTSEKGLWHEAGWAPLQSWWHCLQVGFNNKSRSIV